ncbi:unnamed protein product, partial [Closterium sp. NIES-53]
ATVTGAGVRAAAPAVAVAAAGELRCMVEEQMRLRRELKVSPPSSLSANDTSTPGSPVLLLGSPFGVLAPTLFANR